MQGIYNCIPETNHASMVYCCSYAIVTVYATGNVIYRDGKFVISTFLCMCALPPIAFCGALISCFPIMLLRYFMSDFVIFPVAPIYYWYQFCIYTSDTLYFYCKVLIF